ncbi:MAG: MarR family transcriptional regulator, partial [Clostridia bacterium]|nr:MarR family transcriptional regulator [Clostridia bacterium]
MSLKESGEMYLESIYVLNKRNLPVRSTDLAEYMGYSKPSVSRAVGLLKNQGYIEVDKN